jgi:hypothetical protein
MRMNSKKVFFSNLIVFILCNSEVKAQTPNLYTYQELSHYSLAKTKDSLKKEWLCPVFYKEKETQKKFKEVWDERTDFITKAIDNKNFIFEKEIHEYVDQVISQLVKGNPKIISVKPVVLIDRSASVNAYSLGGNIIGINLGLFSFAQSREELALVIAHELSHNILNHAENSMREKAEWTTSDEYKKTLNSVLDSKYERYTRLKKVFEGYSFNRTKHSRYHESDADSLAVLLLNNSQIQFDARYFLRLDSTDIQYRQPLKNSVRNYFTDYGLPFEDWWTQKRTKGLSTKAYNFKDSTSIADSLKTHPDCKERYQKTKSLSVVNAARTPIPVALKNKANKMILWNIFDNKNLASCLYRILQEKDNGNKDKWYDFMVYNIFAGLVYSDNELNRFNAINILSKEYISQEYYELQNMLEQMPRESLEEYFRNLTAKNFWQDMSPDAKALRVLFQTLNDKEATEKAKDSAAKAFLSANANSMYCEFAEHFVKK